MIKGIWKRNRHSQGWWAAHLCGLKKRLRDWHVHCVWCSSIWKEIIRPLRVPATLSCRVPGSLQHLPVWQDQDTGAENPQNSLPVHRYLGTKSLLVLLQKRPARTLKNSLSSTGVKGHFRIHFQISLNSKAWKDSVSVKGTCLYWIFTVL